MEDMLLENCVSRKSESYVLPGFARNYVRHEASLNFIRLFNFSCQTASNDEKSIFVCGGKKQIAENP